MSSRHGHRIAPAASFAARQRLRQPSGDIPKRGKRRFQVFNDLLLQDIRRRQVVEIVQAVIFQPEDIKTRLVTGHQVFVAEEPETFSGDAFVLVFRVVTGDEILQVIQLERACLQGEVLVGAQAVEPYPLGVDVAVFGLA